MVACFHGSGQAAAEFLQLVPDEPLKCSLHVCLGGRANPAVVSLLLEAKADVDEEFSLPRNKLLWLLMKLSNFRHRISSQRSRLSTFAFHLQGATPLMFSVLSGSREGTAVLLAAGARKDLRNSRGRTASALALELETPDLGALVSEAPEEQRNTLELAPSVADAEAVDGQLQGLLQDDEVDDTFSI